MDLVSEHVGDVKSGFLSDGNWPGDTQAPFSKLGKDLRLPQTATLALQAPDR